MRATSIATTSKATRRTLIGAITVALAMLSAMLLAPPVGADEPGDAVDLDGTDAAGVSAEPDGAGDLGPLALPEGDCASGEIYDDGEAENGYSGNPAAIDTFDAVMLFTPESYPAVYETICLSLVGLGGPTHQFTIRVWDDDGADNAPGTLLGETDTLTVDDLPDALPCTMYEVDVSDAGIVIPDGSVYIGVRWNPMDFPSRFICADETAETQLQPGYVNFDAGDDWQPTQTTFTNYRALLVRAVQDITPPETTITSGPGEGSIIEGPTATFEFSSDEANSTFECRLDGAAFEVCSGPSSSHTTGELAMGDHTMAVRAVDPAGNIDPTPATRDFKVWKSPDPNFRFEDVPPLHTFDFDIHWLAANGITRGCNPPVNDLFCPQDPVTRGQMAAFLNRALGLASSSTDFFVDDDESTFQADINALAASGITRGCNPPVNDRFCPDDNVTREQMAAFLVRAFDLSANTHGGFVDVGSSNTFFADIGKLATAQITRGCNPPANTMYCPKEDVTRGQMAAFLFRALTG
jgi:hypothetical protein